MKFAEHLAAHITPEWRKQYIQYEAMKDMLYDAVEQAPSPEMTSVEAIQAYFARFDEEFLQFCDKELTKINTFFSEKLAEATRKFANLNADLALAQRAAQHAHTSAVPPNASENLRNRRASVFAQRRASVFAQLPMLGDKAKEKQTTVRKMHDIKLAFSEFYLSVILLQNYQTLNFTGFRKILKKHDKLLEMTSGAHWRQATVETAPFYTSKQVDHLIKETESVFTSKLEGGDRQKAMKRLRVPPLGDEQNPWTTFRVGLFAGIFSVLCGVAIIAAIFTTEEHATDWVPALRMYRGTFLIILMVFLLGINTYGWRSSGVNHVLIFELNPRDHLSHQQLLEVAGFFGVLWGLSVVSYLLSSHIYIPVFANPFCLVGFCILYLLNPIHILHYSGRTWLLKVLYRILTAPFHHVGFADFWLADQLNSLVTVLSDLEFLICFYATNMDWSNFQMKTGDVVQCGSVSYAIPALVACLPAWFRFAQCLRRYRDTRLLFPHIVNAGKYCTTFFVVLFSSLYSHYKHIHPENSATENPFYYLWIISALISTCYTFTWDVKMDWGLFDKNAGENRFLREEIVYAYKSYYYFAVIEDFVLRFAWVITVSVGEKGLLHGEILKSILAPLEVFRRFVWNFFRLENEHLNNCGQFRAVRDISIAPIDANDQALLEKMMDEDDGVVNRKSALVKTYPGRANKEETQLLIEADENVI